MYVIFSVTIHISEFWFVNVQDVKFKAIIKAHNYSACNCMPIMCGAMGLETFDNEFSLNILF